MSVPLYLKLDDKADFWGETVPRRGDKATGVPIGSSHLCRNGKRQKWVLSAEVSKLAPGEAPQPLRGSRGSRQHQAQECQFPQFLSKWCLACHRREPCGFSGGTCFPARPTKICHLHQIHQ